MFLATYTKKSIHPLNRELRLFIDWELSPYRTKEHSRLAGKKDRKEIDNMLSEYVLEHELGIRDREGELNSFYPRFGQDVSMEIRHIWNAISSVVGVEGSMFGVALRDNLDGTLNILEKEGLCEMTLKPVVQEYERKLLEFHNKKTKNKG